MLKKLNNAKLNFISGKSAWAEIQEWPLCGGLWQIPAGLPIKSIRYNPC